MYKNKLVLIILGGLVLASGSFYGGMRYGSASGLAMARGGFSNLTSEERAARTAQFGGGAVAGGNRMGGRAAGGGVAAGEIILHDDKSLTIKLPAGGSQIVFLTDKTPVMKSVAGSSSDLSIGAQVVVSGVKNPDGSITAQSVQLRTEAINKNNQ